jgi:hypothetical protein
MQLEDKQENIGQVDCGTCQMDLVAISPYRSRSGRYGPCPRTPHQASEMEVEALDAILMDLAAGSRPFRRSHRRFQGRYDHWSRRMERQGVPPFAAKNVTKTPLVGGQ